SLDMWHWKYVRGGFSEPSQVDDQFLSDNFDPKAGANAGRTSDAGQGGYYVNVRDMKLADGTTVRVPKYGPKNGSTNEFILTQAMIDNGTYVELTDVQVMALPKGTKLPSQIGRAFTGSRGDITAKAQWTDGKYTLEIKRKLNTGDKDRDVQFTDLAKTYYFGIATFDNTQIKHAVSDLIELKFRK
ncbi:MAG TPA: ethylbenzene dehydrogenase-related protein, partial [Deinococcales bacterium]|nr:ethylbenzene dehydrogenase-related protein [Deinococcales bacterium]